MHPTAAPPPCHFLHFGKTGGTALKLALASAGRGIVQVHPHATTLADVPPGERVFFFVRDPVTRFVSGFYSRQRQGRPRYNSPWSPAEATAFAIFRSPNELALALTAEDTSLRGQAFHAMRSIAHVRDSYWRWLVSPEMLERRRDDILFIGQQEHLADDAAALSGRLRLDKLVLPEDEVAAHRNPPGLDRRLEPVALANLRRWYAADYEALQLCSRIVRERRLGGSLELAA